MNPAAYSAIDSMSFFFEAGLEAKIQRISSGQAEQDFSDINFDHFAFGFGVGPKMGISFGVRPATKAGYMFETLQQEATTPHILRVQGSGNITNLYGGLAYQLLPQLSLGINADFWFGDVTHTSYQEFIENPGDYKFGLLKEHRISNVMFDFGLQNTTRLGENKQLVVGAIFRPKTGINGETNTVEAQGYNYDPEGNLFTTSIILSEENNQWSSSMFEMPMKLGLGVSYSLIDKLTVAADYSTERWADSKFPDESTETANTTYLSFGAEFIPNERTAGNYLQRIRYRAGIHYNEDYIMLNDYQLRDFGMSFGLGLPLGRSNTSVNLGFEYGNIGTEEPNQIKETYGRFTLSFTMHEYWFMKRKFD
ncbi:putative outer membrane protein [Geofilum rubicundum JCM 15548]|uniref:Putative outer membrane protein n=2 Tax=Geofilum TaxID=1236988 RepID=A0A0E9M1F8_9BACT|nr:putative outer membrane protein [Geofilum rubicundum JCM 15548]